MRLEEEMKERIKREGLEYCGKFKNLFHGWCGMTKDKLFKDDGEVFMCRSCIKNNLKKFANHAISETGGKDD